MLWFSVANLFVHKLYRIDEDEARSEPPPAHTSFTEQLDFDAKHEALFGFSCLFSTLLSWFKMAVFDLTTVLGSAFSLFVLAGEDEDEDIFMIE
jgi:hypothetical protein